MIVAQLRGVKFNGIWPANDKEWVGAYTAVRDVAKWLGFAHVKDYTRALPEEKKKIFERAKRYVSKNRR